MFLLNTEYPDFTCSRVFSRFDILEMSIRLGYILRPLLWRGSSGTSAKPSGRWVLAYTSAAVASATYHNKTFVLRMEQVNRRRERYPTPNVPIDLPSLRDWEQRSCERKRNVNEQPPTAS